MYRLIFILTMIFLMTGCTAENDYSQEETIYIFENIQFESDFWGGNKAFIETEEKTIVTPIKSLSFVKREKETTLKIITHLFEGEKSSSRPIEYVLYVNEKDLKAISKDYANAFQSTIELIEE